ncbi:LacI family DNA-binding transcriptional regulator [Streptomyces sp. NPDC014734]|uniref:LacI family DNA-binding transcriptional regulator n=1 Tax=Streptomyces sp. NPDC014734 TaxID=3364886 RepID=UPI003700853F
MTGPAPDSPRDTRPTLEAVAALAGVSRATASRVVNGGAGVRRTLVEQVRMAVDELGYVPNHAARTLVTRRNGAIAVIIDEPESRIFSDPFFSRQIRGISRELNAHDAQLVLLLVEGSGDFDRVARYLAGGHVDGALVFSLHTGDGLPAVLRRFRVPTVYGGRPARPGTDAAPAVPYVDCDNRGGAAEAVRHLVSLGRRRIAHIAGPRDQTSAQDRVAGYRDVLPDADPGLVVPGDFTVESGVRAMARLLDRRPGPDAVFAANDLMASGALRVLRERGLRVPEDVAVIGFDDMASIAEATDPPLTTVRQDVEGMGRLMARLLIRTLNGAEEPVAGGEADGTVPVITSTALVRRASA